LIVIRKVVVELWWIFSGVGVGLWLATAS